MEIKDIIFVPSVQHTGTWFALTFLKSFITNCKENVEVFKSNKAIAEPTIIHTHFPILQNLNVSFDINYSFEQMVPKDWKCMSVESICMMSKIFKTVIPIRDPLAAILSRESRHPELRHFYIIDGFVEIATRFANNPNVKFLPIDLTDNPDKRKKILTNIMEHCSIPLEPYRKTIEDWAAKWPVQNPTPGNRFKKHYDYKDKGAIRYLLGPKLAELEYLQHKASIILPFLSNIGYTKEDLDLW